MKLVFEGIGYRPGGRVVLCDATGAVSPGECVVLVGRNGTGKTSLADIICGLRNPDCGNVRLGQQNLLGLRPFEVARQGVSRMFQAPRLAWNLTAGENIAVALLGGTAPTALSKIMFPRLSGQYHRDAHRHGSARNWLSKVGLADEEHTVAHALSFGQQRLLEFLRTLAFPSQVLLLDEPFAGLKSNALEQMICLLKEALYLGRSVILIDHTFTAMEKVVSKAWILDGGKILQYESLRSLRSADHLLQNYDTNRTDHDDNRDRSAPSISDASRQATLEVKDICGGYGKRPIVRKATFSVNEGEILSIVGRNGCGKSTLLKLIAGLLPITSGEIHFHGCALHDLPAYRRVQRGIRLLPQRGRIFQTLSVRDNFAVSAVIPHGSTDDSAPPFFRSSRALQRLAEDAFAVWADRIQFRRFDALASCLSGGEQAQMALGLISLGTPLVLLLDEPTSGLDSSARSRLAELLCDWRRSSYAIVLVDHDLEFVSSISNRVAVMEAGSLADLEEQDFRDPRTILARLEFS